MTTPLAPTAAPSTVVDPKTRLQLEGEANAALGRAAFDQLRQALGHVNPTDVASTISPTLLGTATKQQIIQLDRFAFEPKNGQEAFAYAKFAVESRLVPYDNPATALFVIMTGRELGLTVAQSLRSIHVVKGHLTLSSHLHAALVLRSSLAEYFYCYETTPQRAVYTTKRKGDPDVRWHVFNWDQARQAGLVKADGNWMHWPDAMCRARCVSEFARIVYPDAVLNLYTPDEVDPQQEVSIYTPPGWAQVPQMGLVFTPAKTAEELQAEAERVKAQTEAVRRSMRPQG